MMTLMRNGRDRRSENPLRATRGKNACFCLGPISGSHQGQQPERLHSKAGYMAAPERFAETSDFPLAPRAPSIHGTLLPLVNATVMSAAGKSGPCIVSQAGINAAGRTHLRAGGRVIQSSRPVRF